MKKPTEILTDEHKNILKVVSMLDEECDSLEQKAIDKDFFVKVIDFIRNYADRFHHAKEEDILFYEMNHAEGLHCNPVEQMLFEHDMGRNFVKGMEQAVEKNDKNRLEENARGYIGLIREHIFKEDNILYPMADEGINKKVQDSMLKRFQAAEQKNKKSYSIRGFKL